MADAESRALARRHTAQLLKMLRGPDSAAGANPDAPSAPVAKPALIAEAVADYERWKAAMARPPPPAPAALADAPPPPPQPRGPARPIPSVAEVLRRPTGLLGQLLAQAGRLRQLSQTFQAYLPPHLRDHAVLIRLDAERWEVHTDAASWATRLRYALATIREPLGRQLGVELPKPRIRVKPAASPDPPRRPRLTLTRRNAELLETAARSLNDPRLGAALRQLAAHGRAQPPSEL